MLKLDPIKQELPAKKKTLTEIGESLGLEELKKQAEEFVRYCALNDDLQKVMFTSSSGAPVRKNITNSQEIAETLMNGNDNTESITPETLDNILENAGEEPEFDKYGQAMEHADYLLTNSINNDTLNNDLSEITRELNTMLKE